jgi:hypothetical protein
VAVDVAHPIRTIVPTLDGSVLEVLTRTTRPLSGREITRIADAGSPSGVRRVLARLVEQGLVHAAEHSAAIFYTANRDHLAWPAVEILTGLRRALLDRLRDELGNWQQKAVHASMFGSVARREGDAQSDIDILLVHPGGIDEDEPPWAEQVDELRRHVQAWTGNRCQAFQISLDRLAEYVQAGDPLVENWLRDSITLTGINLRTLVRQLPTVGGDQ